MAETVPVTFLYHIGQHVRWRDHTNFQWTVVARMYVEGGTCRPVRYGIALTDVGADRPVSVDEADLEPCEEDTPHA